MKKTTEVSVPAEAAEKPVQAEPAAKAENADKAFTVNPADTLTVICGNTVVFTGKGARKVTVASD